jgi:hypothetical protein
VAHLLPLRVNVAGLVCEPHDDVVAFCYDVHLTRSFGRVVSCEIKLQLVTTSCERT